MKLNNKGFLISGILYSLLLLFLVLIIGMTAILSARQNKISYITRDVKSKLNDKYESKISKIWTFEYTGDYQVFTVPTDGFYSIELWGAQGGDMTGQGFDQLGNSRGNLTYYGGKGAYTKGIIYLNKGENIYIYVGGKGSSNKTGECVEGDSGGYNGGGNLLSGQCVYGSSGGGATDIRLVQGVWNDFNSLKSRIMVAAGGGGANFRNHGFGEGNGGAGGAYIGVNGQESLVPGSYFRPDYPSGYGIGTGGTQKSGGINMQYNLDGTITEMNSDSFKGDFGKVSGTAQSGAGSGYYGGGNAGHGGAGGGSSFVSGLYGCEAIDESSVDSGITFRGSPNHYSRKVFTNAIMIAGDSEMPSHEGSSTITGNSGNGYAKISLLSLTPQQHTLTNLVLNGNFEINTENWINESNITSTLDSTNRYIGLNSVNAKTTSTAGGSFIQKLSIIQGHKYYAKQYINIKSSPNGEFDMFYDTGTIEGKPEYGNVGLGSLEIGKWKQLSFSFTAATSDVYNYRPMYSAAITEAYIDATLLVDLTAAFGAGNEPTKEWCDENISYFDGTISIYK